MASIWNWLKKAKKIKDDKLINFRYYVIKHTPGVFFKIIINDLISIFILFFKFTVYSLLTIVVLWIWHKNFPFFFRAVSYYIPLFNDIACNIPYVGDSHATMQEIFKATTETKLAEMAKEFEQFTSKNNPKMDSFAKPLIDTSVNMSHGCVTEYKGWINPKIGVNHNTEHDISVVYNHLVQTSEYTVKLHQELEGDFIPRLLDVLNNEHGLRSPYCAKLTVDDLYVLYPSIDEWVKGLNSIDKHVSGTLSNLNDFSQMYKDHVDNFNKKHNLPKRNW